MKRKCNKFLILLAGCVILSNSLVAEIVVDHTCTDIDRIPQSYLDAVREQDIVFYHRFIGDSILIGMQDLVKENAMRYDIEIIRDMNVGWFYEQSGIGHSSFGGNNYPDIKCSVFDDFIRVENFGSVVDIAFFQFSVEDFICQSWWGNIPADSVWETFYKPTMQALEADYLDVTFVWWTAPLNDRWGNDEKEIYNTLVRNYCKNNGKVLFDIADIESHDTLGQPVRDVDGFEAMFPFYADEGTLPNDYGQKLIASGLWWLFAQIAGWNGAVEEEVAPIRLELQVDLFTGSIHYTLPVSSYVKLYIYDVSGREVARLVDSYQTEGNHSAAWGVSCLESGVYFARLQACDKVMTAKVIVLE